VVYGTRESQPIEFVPLDARLGLPAGKFSSLLPDWDQALVVENPYQQVNHVLSRILGLARLPQLDLDFTQFTAFSARKCLIEHNRDT
jgi:hypothetical protein